MSTDVQLTKLATCAGCGAKVGAGELARLFEGFPTSSDPNLLVGFDHADDAAVYRVSDDVAIVQTLDFFPPIADDPFMFGSIAAANSLSDIYAMGGQPILALNIMAIPEDMPSDTVREILRGGALKVAEAGASVAGGHSIYDPEPKYGMSVTGLVDPRKIITNDGAQPGDLLICTKPLGIGILTSAMREQLVSPQTTELVYETMAMLNRDARDAMMPLRVHACTDVTGFGLLGHLLEMAQGSNTQVHLDTSAVALLPEALDLAGFGVLPAGMYRNRSYAQDHVDAGDTPVPVQDLLYDPQTSGGLMIAIHPEDAPVLMERLSRTKATPQLVGRFEAYEGAARIFLEKGTAASW